MNQLDKEIDNFIKLAHKKSLIPVVRLNGTSDIVWYNIDYTSKDGKKYKSLMERFPNVTFYDYTKRHNHKNVPNNYKITFSLAENNEKKANEAIKNGLNVAVVFRTEEFPKTYNIIKRGKKYNVINGDENDLRFLDPQKSIVGLKAKGKAKKDTTGFVKECRQN